MAETKKPEKPKGISMGNTKKEMLAAYNQLLKELEEQGKTEPGPEEQVAQKRQREAVEAADSLSSEGVLRQISELKVAAGRVLNELSEKLQDQVTEYRKVKDAIQAKKTEVNEIYEIEKAASTLTALLQAQSRRKEEFEAEMEARRIRLEQEIEQARQRWESEKNAHELAMKTQKAEDKKALERERDDKAYALKREQQLARDKFEDEKARMEKELRSRKEAAEHELAERERAVAEKEQELAQLREQVKAFPAEMESAVKQAVKRERDELQAKAESEKTLLARTLEGERNVLQTRIEGLEKKTSEQGEQITRLLQQLEAAYQKVQDVAVKAVGGASQAASLTDLQNLLARSIKEQSAREK